VGPPKFFRSLSERPTQTIDTSPCCKTGPSSDPPNENVWLRPWVQSNDILFQDISLLKFRIDITQHTLSGNRILAIVGSKSKEFIVTHQHFSWANIAFVLALLQKASGLYVVRNRAIVVTLSLQGT